MPQPEPQATARAVRALKQTPVSKSVFQHLKYVVDHASGWTNVKIWLRAGLEHALPAMLVNLPGKLDPKDTAAASALAAGIFSSLGLAMSEHVNAAHANNLVRPLVDNRDAWSTMVNWGVLCPEAQQPLPFPIDTLDMSTTSCFVARPGGGTPAELRLTDPWTAQLLALHSVCRLTSICVPLDGGHYMPEIDDPIHMIQQLLMSAASRHVIRHMLDLLVQQHLTAIPWACLITLSAADPRVMLRELQAMRPQLRLAVANHHQLLDALYAYGSPKPVVGVEDYITLLPRFAQNLRGANQTALNTNIEADPRWELLLPGLDIAFQRLKFGQVSSAEEDTDRELVNTLVQQLHSAMAEATPRELEAINELLLQGGRLSRWLERLPEAPTVHLQVNMVRLLGEALGCYPGHSRDPTFTKVAQELTVQALVALSEVARKGADEVQRHAIKVLPRYPMLYFPAPGAFRDGAAGLRLRALSVAVHWGAPEFVDLLFAHRFLSAVLNLTFATTSAVDELGGADEVDVLCADALRRLMMMDILEEAAPQLLCLSAVVHAGGELEPRRAAQARLAWIEALGRCIERGAPEWARGSFTAEDLWEFAADAARQNCAGQQLQRLHSGARAHGMAASARSAAREVKLQMQEGDLLSVQQPGMTVETVELMLLHCMAKLCPERPDTFAGRRCHALLLACTHHPRREVRMRAASVLQAALNKAHDWQRQQQPAAGAGATSGAPGAAVDLQMELLRRLLAADGWAMDSSSGTSQESRENELDTLLACCAQVLQLAEPAAAVPLVASWGGWGALREWSRENASYVAMRRMVMKMTMPNEGRLMVVPEVKRMGVLHAMLCVYERRCGAVPWAEAEGWAEELDKEHKALEGGADISSLLADALQVLLVSDEEGVSPKGTGAAGGAGAAPGAGAGPAAAAGSDSQVGGGMLCCAFCGVTDTAGAQLNQCGGCRGVRYCCKECQRADWKGHKPRCKELQASCAAAAAGST